MARDFQERGAGRAAQAGVVLVQVPLGAGQTCTPGRGQAAASDANSSRALRSHSHDVVVSSRRLPSRSGSWQLPERRGTVRDPEPGAGVVGWSIMSQPPSPRGCAPPAGRPDELPRERPRRRRSVRGTSRSCRSQRTQLHVVCTPCVAHSALPIPSYAREGVLPDQRTLLHCQPAGVQGRARRSETRRAQFA